jgi:LAO/AO transport system kinase
VAFHTYLLKCGDGSYYCGHTDDLAARMRQHEDGLIGYTATRKPVELVWQGEFETRAEALEFELRVKGWSRAKKEALIVGDWEEVRRLAKSGGGAGLRQAQPERGVDSVRSEFAPALRPDRHPPVRPELVEGPVPTAPMLRQAHPERKRDSVPPDPQPSVPREPQPPVRPEPVEGTAPTADPLLHPVLAADRRSLAKAITLLESTRADHRTRADALLNALLPHTGQALRLGISGVPGVGKSTFIEGLGLYLIGQGHRVAVLAVDPSSSLSGGSILGDKTRMEQLSSNPAAYIRPSPSSGTLGGVAEKTREAMLVFEAAGYDVVIVETVGVGQSETAVAGMTDLFVLMQLPNAGDDLQAIKRGVMELADLVVINKADLDLDAATRAEAMIVSSLRLLGQAGHGDGTASRVLKLSALKSDGVEAFWQKVQGLTEKRRAAGEFDRRRQQQGLAWMWDIVNATLLSDFRRHPAVRAALPETLHDVHTSRVAPSAAARSLLQRYTRD